MAGPSSTRTNQPTSDSSRRAAPPIAATPGRSAGLTQTAPKSLKLAMMPELQRAIGNQAAQRYASGAVASPPRVAPPRLRRLTAPVAQRKLDKSALGGMRLQRLMTPSAWTTVTYVRGARRGALLSELDGWIAEYHLKPGPPTDVGEKENRVGILDELADATARWKNEHANDTTKSVVKRKPAVNALQLEVGRDKETLAAWRAPAVPAQTQQIDPQTSKVKQEMNEGVASGLNKVGGLIDLALPMPNTNAELEIDIKAPIGGAAYAGVHMLCKSERDTTNTKVSVQLGVQFGGTTAAAAIGGETGVYIESQGANSNEVMTLISYAIYQRFRESSVIPREVANYMWGGTRSAAGYKLAERWAARVEQQVFAGAGASERFVKRGVYGAVRAAGGVSGGKLGAEAKGMYLSTYNARSIARAKRLGLPPNATPAQQTAALAAMTPVQAQAALRGGSVSSLAAARGSATASRGARTSTGETEYQGIFTLKGDFGPISAQGELTVASGAYWKVEVSGKAMFNLLELGGGGAGAEFLKMVGGMGLRMSSLLSEKAAEDPEDEHMASNTLNMVGDVGGSIAALKTAITTDPKIESLNPNGTTFNPQAETETAKKSSIGLEGKLIFDKAAGGAPELQIFAKQARGIESAIITAMFEQGKLLKKWGGA